MVNEGYSRSDSITKIAFQVQGGQFDILAHIMKNTMQRLCDYLWCTELPLSLTLL